MNGCADRELDPGDVILRRGEPGDPARLAATADAPPVLFVRGRVEVLELPAIAIVGAREASEADASVLTGSRVCSRSAALPSPRAWPAASTRRRIAARSTPAGPRSP